MASTATYLVIETGDPFAARSPSDVDPLVEALAGATTTTIVLAQNAVLAARRGSVAAERLSQLASSARVLADDFSLRERGIRPDEIVAGVSAVTIEELVDLILADGCRALWH